MASQNISNTAGSTVEHQLVEAAGYFTDEINRRAIMSSLWIRAIEQETMPDDMGDTVRTIVYERTLPIGTQVWSPINSGATLGESNNFAVPGKTVVPIAQTIREFGISHTAIESVPIAVNAERFSHRRQEQLRAVFDNLNDNVRRIWELRYRDEYRRLCGTKYVIARATASGPIITFAAADYPTNIDPGSGGANISTLTPAFLRRIYHDLIRDGAGDHALSRRDNNPIFVAYIDSEDVDNIYYGDLQFRQDVRDNPQAVPELLKPFGVSRTYRGFMLVADQMAPRYNYLDSGYTGGTVTVTAWDARTGVGTATIAAGTNVDRLVPGTPFEMTNSRATRARIISFVSQTTTAAEFTFTAAEGSTGTGVLTTRNRDWTANMTQGFVEVPFYVPASAAPYLAVTLPGDVARSQASRSVVNPEYPNAVYAEGFVIHPKVMKSLIVPPVTSLGSGTSFPAHSFRGDFRWVNEYDRVTNPDKNWGFYRGLLASGSKPVFPEYGVAFMYRRQPTTGMFLPPQTMVAAASAFVQGYAAGDITADAVD